MIPRRLAPAALLPRAVRPAVAPAPFSVHARPSSSTRPPATLRSCAAPRLPGRLPARQHRDYSTAGHSSKAWSFDEVRKLVGARSRPSDVVLVDVREPEEMAGTGRIPGAVNIPVRGAAGAFAMSERDFEDAYGFARPAREGTTLLFYCLAGVRAGVAAAAATEAGWRADVYPGSWLDWEANGGKVAKVTRKRGGGEAEARGGGETDAARK
ncbi:uncharacterized protein UV8b_00944 [Ustilaginoidea virens]|uniref:Rhodanese domain-containing protein n=1 Tax=Ustilaginoidea virens TaxID=1159556 RepID=A0A8E5HK04_USTVR|nr:uncharacterized protein UV8b_00944 [Ustilaginoidea virens]QUC16703.1 hypothetical protein UV8b_00944 [Ustilaginoidea virens]